MSKILLKNIKYFIPCEEKEKIITGIDLLITDNVISKIGKNIKILGDEEIIDCGKFAVLPGFVNTHHHFYQAMFRCIRTVQEKPLFPWLVDLYEFWKYLDEEIVYLGAKVALGELLKTGCTLSSDHHYLFPNNNSRDLIDYQIKAAKELGIRFHSTRGSMSRGKKDGGLPPNCVVQDEDSILQDSKRLIDTYHDSSYDAMTRIALAPCSPFSVSKEIMMSTAELARKYNKVFLHTHLAETLDEEEYCKDIYGCRPAELMDEVGWIGKDVWFAHGIHLSDNDLKILKGAGIAHCPSSNMKLNSGICRTSELYRNNIPISIAVDGSASNDGSNMWEEVRRAFLLNHLKYGTEGLSAYDILRIATNGGAKVLGRDHIGVLKENYLADMILIDVENISYSGCHDIAYGLVSCGNTSLVDYNIVNGKIVVKDGKLVNVDEKELFKRANKKADEIVAFRYNELKY
ncbi:8-oxoguanine deaminase [Oceanirhabdus sp. W0125-5]|uniref:8-oxoguanine deaminase n=1 Tax=Oceanirhabdus sp. W0125-5 TaxID=2999116 RepID=UPI0022F33A17|nr:8-oxoguanine deaminase [Oceanirhabdus sp. W0125-5]WBW95146.1 8-oxoguanine deaminase [Oceanirhabdus sp. W0125-5]